MDYITFKQIDVEETLVLCVDLTPEFETGDEVHLLDKTISTSNMVQIVRGEECVYTSIENLEIANW